MQYLLSGSVSKNNNAIRFRVKLIEAQSGIILFSSHFEHTLTDIFAIQQQISEQVVQKAWALPPDSPQVV